MGDKENRDLIMTEPPDTPATGEQDKAVAPVSSSIIDLIRRRGGSPGEPIGPLWLDIAACLRAKGVHHLREALLAVAVMASAHVGLPLALFISAEDGVNGTQFLAAVDGLIPADMKVEFSRLSDKILRSDPTLVKGKVVVLYDVDALKTGRDILKNLLERGTAMDQLIGKKEGIATVSSVQIQGPTSVVALAPQTEPEWLKDFPAMRITLAADQDYIEAQLARRKQPRPQSGLESAAATMVARVVAVELQRLKAMPVDIPFIGQIMDSLDNTDPQIISKLDQFERLLKTITLINHAIYASQEEKDLGFYGIQSEEVAAFIKNVGQPATEISVNVTPPGIAATKVDYYIFHKIAAEVFSKGDDQLTPRQIRIFNAVKTVNLNFIHGGTLFVQNPSEKQIIKILDAQDRGWASVEDICEKLTNDGGMRISKATVTREISNLQEKEVIFRKKDPVATNKFRYRLNILTLGSQVELPHPSTILDPIYKGAPVTVTDLLSGKQETI
jgi:predicted transcriptional regulator